MIGEPRGSPFIRFGVQVFGLLENTTATTNTKAQND